MHTPAAPARATLWRRWQEIGAYVGDFQARLVLTVFYFTVALPFAVLARAVIDPLRLRRAPTGSAWIERKTLDPDLSSARRQF